MSYYNSPRWTGEILDCSMPLTFDQYNKCSYNCLYCFSYYQKANLIGRGKKAGASEKNYQSSEVPVQGVNSQRIRRIFNQDQGAGQADKAFYPYIKRRIPMQWGGLADPFDEYERRHGLGLELLQIFKDHNYPLCFSTKGTWWLEDERYTRLFEGQKNWNVKFSVIGLDPMMARRIERGCPSPEARIKAIGRFAALKAGGATLRLRPFLYGFSDKHGAYLDLIARAAKAGATAVSTEFFCLEGRAAAGLKARYAAMSEALGFDIWKFYRKWSTSRSGYMRLSYEFKRPFFEKMQEACKKLKMRFYVSDAHHKEKCCNGSCCGLPESWNYSRGQFTHALMLAKRNGKVTFSEIKPHLVIFEGLPILGIQGLGLEQAAKRGERIRQTIPDIFREFWNRPNSGKSPYKYFAGVLRPAGLDEHNDVIYEFDYARAGMAKSCKE